MDRFLKVSLADEVQDDWWGCQEEEDDEDAQVDWDGFTPPPGKGWGQVLPGKEHQEYFTI